MTRFDAMYKIVNFGKQEEKNLLAEGKFNEAFQIEHARDTLIYFLNENPIKKVLGRIEAMTNYTIDEKGFWRYDMRFVMDEFTRNLLLELKKEFT
jgi:hypothetical protein